MFFYNFTRFGHSLGSAVSVFVTVALVERRNIRIAGLILQVTVFFRLIIQSCFLSIYNVLIRFRKTNKHDLYVTRDIVEFDKLFYLDRKSEMSCLLASWEKRFYCSSVSCKTFILYDY